MSRSPKSFIHSDVFMKNIGQNPSIGSKDKVQPSSFGQYFVFLSYSVWARLTLKVGSLEPLFHWNRIAAVLNFNKQRNFTDWFTAQNADDY